MKKKIDILFEDTDLCIVNKPASLLSIPDRFSQESINLKQFLESKYGEIWVVHRLDKETSGVICFAKKEETHQILSLQFEQREVEKSYLAIVEGKLQNIEGKIDLPIAKNPQKAGRMMVSNKGKEALTTYKVLEQFRQFALVEVSIKTGRTHQIRVHFQAIGHPLAVDQWYGHRQEFFVSQIKNKGYNLGKGQEERPLICRTALHAYRLGFKHPNNKKWMSFEAPLPKDINALIKQLRKWGT